MRICCILHHPGQTLWAIFAQGMRDEASKHDLTLVIRPAYGDADHLPELLECLRNDQVDAVIFGGGEFTVPHDAAASAAHISFVTCLGLIQGVPIGCEIRANLRGAAALAADYLAERMQGRGSVLHLQGPRASVYTTPRTQGFTEALAAYPEMKIVVAAHGNWERDSGARAAEDALRAYPTIQAVFAHSDEMAIGAQQVLAAAGRHDILIVGIDAIPEALSAIHRGTMAATVNIGPYAMGSAALAQAVALVHARVTPPVVHSEVHLITAANLLDATLETVHVFPNVLRDLVEGSNLQRQLQADIIGAQQNLIRELSTPILPVSDNVLVVPLIGTIDTQRASQIIAAVLEAVSKQNTQTLILDITGVPVVDTSVLHHLLQTVSAARLLGTTVLLVGIVPEVAQTIVQLGVDLSSIVTRSTLRAGLEYATRRRSA